MKSSAQLASKAVLILLITLFLASCGVVKTTTDTDRRTDSDRVSSTRVIESGIASWYGSKFHGKATANGETYNMNDLTAAHKTLPFNTVVRVENMTNGKSVVVRINDRGPYIGDRIIDLSRRAARDIDMENAGTAEVQIFLVREGDRPLTARNTSSRETFTVQLASYNSRSDAETFSRGISGSRVEAVPVAGVTVYRVYYGSFSRSEEAARALRELESNGIEGFVKQEEN